MSLIIDHWSVSPPVRLNVYHVEFSLKENLDTAYNNNCYALIKNPDEEKLAKFDWSKHFNLFNVWKNFDFSIVSKYGTWDFNHDPRDNSANIDVSALTMDGSGVQVQGPWGPHPYTAAHALMHCALNARIAYLKNIDLTASFDSSPYSNLIPGRTIHTLETHGSIAYSTNDLGQDTIPKFGYGLDSGDSSCRWDCDALDERDAHLLGNSDPNQVLKVAQESAATLRTISHTLKTLPMTDMLELDK